MDVFADTVYARVLGTASPNPESKIVVIIEWINRIGRSPDVRSGHGRWVRSRFSLQGGSSGSPRMYLPRQNNNVGLLV